MLVFLPFFVQNRTIAASKKAYTQKHMLKFMDRVEPLFMYNILLLTFVFCDTKIHLPLNFLTEHVFRRVQGLEEDLEKTEERLLLANQKLDKVKTILKKTTFLLVASEIKYGSPNF
jgi:hypothetical protein